MIPGTLSDLPLPHLHQNPRDTEVGKLPDTLKDGRVNPYKLSGEQTHNT